MSDSEGFTGEIDGELTRDISNALRSAAHGLLPITTAGEPVLRMHAQAYNGQIKQKVFKHLIDVMRTTMLDAPGVGLAAPQIGLDLAFAVVEDHVPEWDTKEWRLKHADEDFGPDPREFGEFPFHAIINPSYEPIGDKTASFYEGCLSVPGYEAVRKRWLDITAKWQDENAVWHSEHLHGWPARIFQHETDHLSGEIYIDKCEIRSLSTDQHLDEYWSDPDPHDAAEALGFAL